MPALLVSFIMPSHNREALLRNTLRELRIVSKDMPSEVIVIDNDSRDDSVRMIRSDFPEVRLKQLSKNIGADARNIGLKMAKGSYIFMLDDDSYPLHGTTEAGIRILESDRTIGCVAFRIQLPDGRYWSNGIHTVFTGCGALFPASVLKKIGGYPKDFLFYAEEYDVSFRLWAKGYRVFNAKDPLVYHQKTTDNAGFEKRLSLLVRNNSAVYSKYMPADRAIKRIEYENWRYKAIAEKESVTNGYIDGLRQAVDIVYNNLRTDKHRITSKAASAALGLMQARTGLNRFLKQHTVSKALVLTAGKLLPEIIDMLGSHSITVETIAEDNRYMIGRRIQNIEIIAFDGISKIDCDCLISGSSSLTVNDDLQRRLASSAILKGLPFLRMCEYDMIKEKVRR